MLLCTRSVGTLKHFAQRCAARERGAPAAIDEDVGVARKHNLAGPQRS